MIKYGTQSKTVKYCGIHVNTDQSHPRRVNDVDKSKASLRRHTWHKDLSHSVDGPVLHSPQCSTTCVQNKLT